MKEKYTVEVAGLQISIVTDEEEEYIRGIADKLDKQVNAVIMSKGRCTKTEAAIFCALDCMDARSKTEGELEIIRRQLAAYMKDIDDLKAENDELKKLLGTK